MKENTILLHIFFVIILVLSFLTKYLGWFSIAPISVLILFIPGYLILDLLDYQTDKRFKKIVYSIALSISITIIIATLTTLIINIVKYYLIIIIISSISLIMEIIFQILLIRSEFYKSLNLDLTSLIAEFKKKISKIKMKKNILYGVTTILVLCSLCFPLYFKKETDNYIFTFIESPPSETMNSTFEFNILANHISKDTIFLEMELMINGTLYLEDVVNSTVSGELELRYIVTFSEYALYHITFNFNRILDSKTEKIGNLIHWMKFIP